MRCSCPKPAPCFAGCGKTEDKVIIVSPPKDGIDHVHLCDEHAKEFISVAINAGTPVSKGE